MSARKRDTIDNRGSVISTWYIDTERPYYQYDAIENVPDSTIEKRSTNGEN